MRYITNICIHIRIVAASRIYVHPRIEFSNYFIQDLKNVAKLMAVSLSIFEVFDLRKIG